MFSQVLRIWLRRYVELKEDRLLFYKPGVKASERGAISMELPLVTVIGVTPPETEQHVIKLMTGKAWCFAGLPKRTDAPPK